MSNTHIQRCKMTPLDRSTDSLVWLEVDGWHGCLRQDRVGNTDFCGPFATADLAIEHLRGIYDSREGVIVS